MKTKPILVTLIFFILPGLLYLACRERKPEWKGTITEKDGVVIVKNPKDPLYPDAQFKVVQELKIGQATGQPEYMFSEIRDIAVDAEGSIYAVESKDHSIRVYDKNGVHRRTIGRPGQGPDEFMEPGNVHVNPAGEIMVTDGGSQSVKFFSPDGRYLRQCVLKMYPMKAGYGTEGIFYIMTFSPEPPGFGLFRLDSRTGESASLATWPMPWPPNLKRASIFDPIMSFAVMPDDRLLYGCPTEGYEIQVFSPKGRLEKRIFRDWDARPVTIKEKEDVFNAQKKRFPAAEAQLEFPKSHPPYRVVTSDDLGHIIVHAYSEQTMEPSKKTETLFDIFDQDGRYLACLRYPFKALIEKPMVWKSGKFYIVEQDEEGYLYIVRYGVEFKF